MSLELEPDEERPTVKLVGENGNAYAVMAACKVAARKAGWNGLKIGTVLAEMMNGDYDHLLATAMKYFDVE